MSKPAPPTRQATLEAILVASGRPTRTLPIRDAFVQTKDKAGKPLPGPVAKLAQRGVDSTFEQYLLAHAWASGGEFDLRKHPKVWQRALGLPDDLAGRRTVLRNWRALADLKLITAERSGQLMHITLLSETGRARAYKHPGETGEDYFQLPYAYWTGGYYEKLTVPGKLVLLIAMTLGDWFWLPPRHAGGWYGVSASTIERGLRQVRRADILEVRSHFKTAPLAPEGYTRENYYRLMAPFGPKGKLARGAPESFKEKTKRTRTQKPKRSSATTTRDSRKKKA